MTNIRTPAQAGTFYPATERELRKKIQESFLHPLGPGKLPTPSDKHPTDVKGLIVPHAGYQYSGPVAAHSYYRLATAPNKKKTIIILGPNHTGLGSGISTMEEGEWKTPLGNVPIDNDLSKELVQIAGLIDIDDQAHRYEHSIEVQLPFLQFIYPDGFKFVPVCMMIQDLRTSIDIGNAVVEMARKHDALIIASSDWTHYEPQAKANLKDHAALDAVLALDETRFQEVIEQKQVSACGYGPVTALVHTAKSLNMHPSLLSYHTSGDVTGDMSAVVGYAAASFEK